MDNYEKALGILRNNAGLTFVKRILEPENFPVLKHENGYATHRMAWGEVDGKYIAFPTVLYDGRKLIDYGDNAFDQIMKTKNYITFDNPNDAEWFTKNYKSAWGGKRDNEPQ